MIDSKVYCWQTLGDPKYLGQNLLTTSMCNAQSLLTTNSMQSWRDRVSWRQILSNPDVQCPESADDKFWAILARSRDLLEFLQRWHKIWRQRCHIYVAVNTCLRQSRIECPYCRCEYLFETESDRVSILYWKSTNLLGV